MAGDYLNLSNNNSFECSKTNRIFPFPSLLEFQKKRNSEISHFEIYLCDKIAKNGNFK